MQFFWKGSSINTFKTLENVIRKRQDTTAQELLKDVNSCELVDASGFSLLHVASESGNETMTQYLLENKLIDVDAQDQNGKTPIMLCLADPNHEKTALTILQFTPNIHIRDNFGKSTLEMVFQLGISRLQFIERFVEILKIENQNDSEIIAKKLLKMNCSLHYAVIFRNSTITRIMAEQGCPINERDSKTGMVPLHVCVEMKDLANVKLLVEEFGADVDAMDSRNRIPFFWNSYDNTDEELEILKILVERTSSLTSLDNTGKFPIHTVTQLGNYEALMVLLNSNIDLNARDTDGNTAIHNFICNSQVFLENPDIVEILRSKIFDANATNDKGETLLSRAAARGIHHLVQLLVHLGADANIANFLNMSPLYLASAHPHGSNICAAKKCVEILLEYNADPQIIGGIGETIFDRMLKTENYYALEPICGQLAILEDRGTRISHFTRWKINKEDIFKNQFELCKRQLEQLKTTEIHGSMTLYKILSENQKNIELYARDDDFFSALMRFDNNYSSNSYYCHLLQSHLDKPLKHAILRREIIDILCKVMRLSYYSNHIIIDKIIGYVVGETL